MSIKGVVVIVLVSLSICYADSVLCKICTEGYEDLTSCTKIGKCEAGSICYTEVNYDDVGKKVIYSGCKSKQECVNLGLISKRGKRDFQVCASCCDTDFCNTEVCGLAPPSGTMECLSCSSVDKLDECGATKLCSISEHCMTEYRYVGNGKAAYRMGCESSEICRLRDQYVKNFTRRRTGPRNNRRGVQPMKLQLAHGNGPIHGEPDVHTELKKKRQITDPYAICLSCCNYSFCNTMENCYIKQEAPPSPVNG